MDYYKQIRKTIRHRKQRFLIIYSAMVLMAILGLVFMEWIYISLWLLLASVLLLDSRHTNSMIEKTLKEWDKDIHG